jgi:hypothetical protein
MCPTTNKKSTAPDAAMIYFLPSEDPKMLAMTFIEHQRERNAGNLMSLTPQRQ